MKENSKNIELIYIKDELVGFYNGKQIGEKTYEIGNICNLLSYLKSINSFDELNIKPSDVDKYLWEIGNLHCNKKDCIQCPLEETCIKQ